MTHHRSDFTVEEGLKLYDDPARKLAKIVVPKVCKNITVVKDNPNQYGVDLIGYDDKGNKVAYIEVECSHTWGTRLKFPFEVLHFLQERKGKYLTEKQFLDLDFYFVMFNENFTSFAITDRENILNSPIKLKRFSWNGYEKVRCIPKPDYSWFIVKELE